MKSNEMSLLLGVLAGFIAVGFAYKYRTAPAKTNKKSNQVPMMWKTRNNVFVIPQRGNA